MTCTTSFLSSIRHHLRTSFLSIGKQMDKEVVVHIPNEILLSYKKEQMDKEVVVHIPNEILLSYKKEQMDKEVVVHIPNEILFSYKKEHI